MSEITAISDTLKGTSTSVSASLLSAQIDSTEDVIEKKSTDTAANAASSSDYYTDSVEISSRAKSLAVSSLSTAASGSDEALSDSSGTNATAASSTQDTSDTNVSSSGGTTAAPPKPSGAPPAKSSSASSSSESSSSDTTDLSTYTEYQLQQMVKSGTITQTQYNAEMSRRESETATTQESES